MGILDGFIDAGDVVDEDLWNLINDEFTTLSGNLSGSGATDVRNGDFEIDTDSDGIPDDWTDDGTVAPIYGGHAVTYPGGTIAFETTSPIDGAQSIKMVHPGGASNGGGLLESNFYSCNSKQPFMLGWVMYSTAAGMKNEVIVYWYDKDQVAHGTPSTTLYNSTVNPTSATQYMALCFPPSGANYYTIGLIGGFTDTDVAGTTYFDGLTKYPLSNMKLNSPTMGTIAENSTTSAAFVSLGTVSINCPIRANKTVFTATISAKGVSSGPVTANVRLGVGTDYSNTITDATDAYTSGLATLTTDTTGGDVTLTLYGGYTDNAGTIYGKMDAPAGKYQLSDEALI